MENSKLKYFVYARRSIEKRDKEERVASVESQINEVQEIAKRENIKIIHTFTETQSAKRPGRPHFDEMIKRIEKGEANGILCWKMDRLARNPIDAGRIQYLLQMGVIKNIKASDRDWYPDDNVLISSVEFGVSNQYSIDLAKHIRRGLRDRLHEGVRPSIAPLGYLNSKYHEKGQEEILVDEERFLKVRKLFDLMLTGQYFPAELVRIADKDLQLTTRGVGTHKSKPMGKSNIYRILTNPFYFGEFEFPEGSGKWYVGKHKAMITKEEYDKIQFLLGRKGRPRPKTHIFAYTGLMRCGGCGARITAEEKWKHQQNGNTHQYIYYRCTGSKGPDCTEESVEVKILEKQIDDFLSKIQIPPEFHEWVVEELKKQHEKEKGDRNSLMYNHESEYRTCVSRLDTLMEMRLDGKMSDEMYQRKEKELLEKKRDLKRLLGGDDNRVNDWLVRLESTLTFAERAREEFKNGDIAKKRQILTALGTEHILKGRAIHIQTEKPLLILEEVVSETHRINDSVEPPKSIDNYRWNDENYAKSSLMWRWGESNPRAKRNSRYFVQT